MILRPLHWSDQRKMTGWRTLISIIMGSNLKCLTGQPCKKLGVQVTVAYEKLFLYRIMFKQIPKTRRGIECGHHRRCWSDGGWQITARYGLTFKTAGTSHDWHHQVRKIPCPFTKRFSSWRLIRCQIGVFMSQPTGYRWLVRLTTLSCPNFNLLWNRRLRTRPTTRCYVRAKLSEALNIY